MHDPRDVENHMVIDAEDEYEYGVGYWMRGRHRKVDPDLQHDLGLPHDDDKPAYDKEQAE